MTFWLSIVGGVYLVLLVFATLIARRKTSTAHDYVMAGSNVGVILGFLTFGATLFSTFTLMGMPDFFRTHGVGAWIFLGVSDAAVAFVVLWYASHLRRRVASSGFKGIAGFLSDCYQTKWAGVLYFVAHEFFPGEVAPNQDARDAEDDNGDNDAEDSRPEYPAEEQMQDGQNCRY